MQRALEFLRGNWWGAIPAYAVMVAGLYFGIWALIEPLGIPDSFKIELGPRWMVHALIVMLLAPNVILGLMLVVRRAEGRARSTEGEPTEEISSAAKFATAGLAYARHLHDESRDFALVTLRNNLSPTLHLLGLHAERAQLGELALNASNAVSDAQARADILIDDLGWASYMATGNVARATASIRRGIEHCDQVIAGVQAAEQGRLLLAKAKGLRHLALIARAEAGVSSSLLSQAENVLKRAEPLYPNAVKRDTAQLEHARAMLIAADLEISQEGRIRVGDDQATTRAHQALQSIRAARQAFAELSDVDRHAKALLLEVRLLDALSRTDEARETQGVLDRLIARSGWISEHSTKVMMGVPNG